MHWRTVANSCAFVLMFFGLAMLLPVGAALIAREPTVAEFVLAFLITTGTGAAVFAASFRQRKELGSKDGLLLVVAVWSVAPAFAAIPLWLLLDGLSFTDGYFEAVSGLTTTGATVLVGLDRFPTSINLWRAELHWLGGMGIIVLAVAILPLLGVGGLQLFRAETPGPMKDARLTPRIAETAKALWYIYAGITIVAIAALKLAGMSTADAIVHAFSAISTGGFSSHDSSIGFFDSPLIESVLVVVMLIGGLNFSALFLAASSRSPRAVLQDPEFRSLMVVVLVCVTVLTAFVQWHGVFPDYMTAFRQVLFNTVSVLTTTGFATTDYSLWPMFAPVLMMLLGTFCTGSGSTGGGIKMIRALLLIKQTGRELARLIYPNAVVSVKIRGQVVQNRIIFAVLAFAFLYVSTTVAFTLVMLLSGADFATAASAIVACLNTIGPGFASVGPATNYAALSDFQTWVCSMTMLVGRLELLTVFGLLSPYFWRR